MIDPPTWGEVLPRTTDHGYINTATAPQRMAAIAKQPEPMKNKDRDDRHRRRREAGDTEDNPDGRAVAAALYGGLDEREPTPEEDGTSE